jgi:very-short-patch-repair endonuclease
VAAGQVVVLARGRYALPAVDQAMAAAHARSAVLSHTSAALYHGWAVKTVPAVPHLTVRRDRRPPKGGWGPVQVHYADLDEDDVVGGIATAKLPTMQQCLRHLPFDEALAVADSALRVGDGDTVRAAGTLARGPGCRRMRRVVALARGGSANPFESCLRAIALDVPGLAVEPQVLITSVEPWCRPDLVDVELRIVLEADSFAWHGDRAALAADARRYNLLVADGWLVLRFAWEQVMGEPGQIRQVLAAVVAERLRQRAA